MRNSLMSLFIVLPFFHSSISTCHASSSYSLSVNFTVNSRLCPIEQSLALLHFKQNLFSFNYSTHSPFDYFTTDYYCERWLGLGYYPKMVTWNRSTDCCKWDGVTCNRFTGDVIGLDLSCSKLKGVLDSDSTLFHLPQLRRLNLAFNNFSGSNIPNEIGRFANYLTHLNLSNSDFEGQIPLEISVLPKLVSLDLSSSFIGSDSKLRLGPHVLDKFLQNSSRLRELSLAAVNMSSSSGLLANLNLSSLRILDLSKTGLSGKLPDNIFSRPYLRELRLSENYALTGSLPKVVNSSNIRIPLEWLDLSLTSLSGEIPDSIGHLTSLNSLLLSGTSLTGEIPVSIGNLTSLNYLFLSSTYLSGEIPNSIGNLTSLNFLALSWTSLSRQIPYCIGHLTSLHYLDLQNCDLFGPIPKSLKKLTHLKFLSLQNNRLNETLPSWLFTHLPSLIYINLSNNTLSGNIPPFAFRSSLEYLNLQQNQLVGPVPQSSFLQLLNLTILNLSFNNFTTGGSGGIWELETLFPTLTKLQDLRLSYSGLSVAASSVTVHYVNPDFEYLELASCKLSVFPEFLRAMKYLQLLDLSNNEIHGHIPDWAGEIGGDGLRFLNLSHNLITGLPQLLQWDRLDHLDLKSNLIQGPFPPSICNMSYLQILDMSNNSFGGALPQCFGGMLGNSLQIVDLRNNLFNGTIPGIYRDCTNLQGLILHRNLLQGEVPRSLAKCRSLELLDLGVNSLSGVFPNWLEDLPLLQVLVLNSNKLGGSITSSSMIELPFPKLRILDLSGNEFVGYLPEKYFRYFKAMRDIEMNGSQQIYMDDSYSITVVMKGVEFSLVKILIAYTMVDLSNNMLQGEIPDAIGSLHSLKALNLSHNNLTGQIPHALGNLAAIESLDLSWNQIRGEIPRELADINSLSTLNLSQNHLTGRIPQGTQFSTFETAFLGNPGLCGFPLPTNCNSNDEPPLSSVLEEDDPDIASGFTWQVVVLGYVCGTLVGLVMGYLMFLTGRPKWFNAAVEREEQRIRRRQKKKRKYVFIGR